MKVSLNTIKQFTDVDLQIDELVARINQQLGGVEEVIDLAERYQDALIVRVVSAEKHPNADRLKLCLIDDGGANQNVERDENGYVQVVCGAPNAETGMLAIWLPPQSTVPASFDDDQPFVLDSRELRGVLSHGMLASAKELAIGDDHNGIVEITRYDLPDGVDIDKLVGQSFAEVFGLNDQIIDIENKMFTHRPDLFGQLGVAREVFAILQSESNDKNLQDTHFEEPDWYGDVPSFATGEGLEIEIFNEAPDKAPRFMAVAMKDVVIKPSPLWLQTTLVRWGSKAINNVVDLTNYIMLLTAQPVHAYDYDKLRGHKLGVRMAEADETVKLLNGKTYSLSSDDIVIVDGEGAVGLAGVMGGGESEVDENTSKVVLEVANFDMYTVRKTSMRYGLFTDALTRFTKGQSKLQNDRALARLVALMGQYADAKLASGVYDQPEIKQDKNTVNGELEIEVDFINKRLGLDLSTAQVSNILRYVNFATRQIGGGSDAISVTAPFWRTDIELKEDIVEEVGRIYGFDKLPRELPLRSIKPIDKDISRVAKQNIRQSLARAGANEVLTYSFVHENTLKKAEQDPAEAFQLSNALSPDLQYYRLTVLPSLLDKVHMNIKAGHDEFVLFEIGKGHNKKYHATDDEGGLPSEMKFVDMIYANKQAGDGAAFYRIRSYIDQLVRDFGRQAVYLPLSEDYQYPVTAPFDLSRSAMVHDAKTNEFLGMIGELKSSVRRAFKLPNYSAAATLDFAAFEKLQADSPLNYRPISKYPSVSQDVSLEVQSDQHYIDLYDLALKTLEGELDERYNWNLSPVSIYQADGAEEKVITLRLKIENYSTTMTDQEVQEFISLIVDAAKKVYGARQK